jgi:hypothetical protein
MSRLRGFLTEIRRHWPSVVLFVAPLAIYVVASVAPHVSLPDPVLHVLLTLTAVTGIHLLDRLHVIADTRDEITQLAAGMRGLLATSESLQALAHRGITRVYAGRAEASIDIRTDLTDGSNQEIRIIGVSLNDFVRGTDQLEQAWVSIRDVILGRRHIDDLRRGLHIRVMLIDPRCHGAILRSRGEMREPTGHPVERLRSDVDAAAKELHHLQKEAASEGTRTGVTFECRLYRLPPILFLCWTDATCYVQQYHFWTSRDNSTPIPVMKYRRLSETEAGYSYHQQMASHFDWIWQHASVALHDYLYDAAIGTDEGLNECGLANIYTDDRGKDRMVHLLGAATRRVTIQGISLHSFFAPGPLFEAIAKLVDEGRVSSVDVLLLDPNCDQARIRSYRERLLVDDTTYEQYVKEGLHEKSDLYLDTQRTAAHIQTWLQRIARGKPAGWTPCINVRFYSSAPACFALRIDDRVLVEQYHYGKGVNSGRAILGKDMPTLEYEQNVSPLYKELVDPLRNPFELLVDHLNFVIAESTSEPVRIHDATAASAPAALYTRPVASKEPT